MTTSRLQLGQPFRTLPAVELWGAFFGSASARDELSIRERQGVGMERVLRALPRLQIVACSAVLAVAAWLSGRWGFGDPVPAVIGVLAAIGLGDGVLQIEVERVIAEKRAHDADVFARLTARMLAGVPRG